MASEINRTGRIALYGLYFDTNRTEIKPESRPTLEQIADLLKREPDLKILVVGHTDNVGDFESKVKFQQRYVKSHRKVPPTPSHLPCDLSWLPASGGTGGSYY
jgi:OOP family OmpA-OmpF porin